MIHHRSKCSVPLDNDSHSLPSIVINRETSETSRSPLFNCKKKKNVISTLCLFIIFTLLCYRNSSSSFSSERCSSTFDLSKIYFYWKKNNQKFSCHWVYYLERHFSYLFWNLPDASVLREDQTGPWFGLMFGRLMPLPPGPLNHGLRLGEGRQKIHST